jgi:hypothetical protein
MSQDKAEKLLQNSKNQKRSTSEPSPSDETVELTQTIQQAYEAIDNGDASSNITVRDTNLAALFHGLEESDDLAHVAVAARSAIDREDNSNVNRSQTIGDLIRVGLQEVAPETVDQAMKAKKEYLLSKEDEF